MMKKKIDNEAAGYSQGEENSSFLFQVCDVEGVAPSIEGFVDDDDFPFVIMEEEDNNTTK